MADKGTGAETHEDIAVEQKTAEKTVQSEFVLQVQKLCQGLTMASLLKLTALTGLGLLGRVALQGIPSVEPIVPMAIVVSFFLGYKYGLPSGMASFYLSNFLVWGGHGPWTVFQVLGTGAAALAGGFFGRLSKSRYSLIAAAVLGTLFYELIVDLSFLAFGFFSPFLLFILPLPFTITHIASSLGFSLVLYAFKDKISEITNEILEIRLHSLRRVVSGSRDIHGEQPERLVRGLSVRRWKLRRGGKPG